MLLESGQQEEALRLLRLRAREDIGQITQSLPTLELMARAARASGDLRACRIALQAALKLAPNRPDLLEQLAAPELRVGAPGRPPQDRESRGYGQGEIETLLTEARALLESGQQKEALRLLQLRTREHPAQIRQSLPALELMARAARASGDLRACRAALEFALKLAPNRADLLEQLANPELSGYRRKSMGTG